jgi:stage II sporulation protein AA (anti-sigma F factor antagonist)
VLPAVGVKLKVEDNYLIAFLEGDLDLHTVKRIREQVDSELEKTGVGTLLLDLSRVSFMDSSGLGFILGRYRCLREKGGKVILVAPRAQVRRVLELSGVGRIMKISASIENACPVGKGEGKNDCIE